MSNQFSTVPSADIRRSSFDRSHGYKTAFDAGYLIPFYVDEVLPGDTFNLKVNLFARLATPVVPIMDNIYLDTFFFFVPTRLVWDNFEKFMGARDNPTDSIDYLIPQFQPWQNSTNDTGDIVNAVRPGDLLDYMGIPSAVGNTPTINALPLRAYNLIWNEWFRDENLQRSIPIDKGDGPDTPYYDVQETEDLTASIPRYRLLRRGKRHDYFTSALPWPQKGPGVDLPITLPEYAPVGVVHDLMDGQTSHTLGFWDFTNGTPAANGDYYYHRIEKATNATFASLDYPSKWLTPDQVAFSGGFPTLKNQTGHFSPLVTKFDEDSTGGATVNSLRQAFMLQQLLERDARGGTRYTEILRSHFNTISPDFRLQRPEYLGGSSGLVNIHQVAQTGSTTATSPQGNLAAYGVYGDRHHGFVKSFVEHGYIIGLCNIRATLSYQQGIERMWNRKTRYDFYWPSLAHLGEQEILNKEIYVQDDTIVGDSGKVNEEVFGYQERYAEYRYKPSLVTGILRSQPHGFSHSPVDYWHLAQYFESLPKLNPSFIEDNPPIARALAVPSEPHFILDAWFDLNCVRPMPVHSIPGFLPHF